MARPKFWYLLKRVHRPEIKEIGLKFQQTQGAFVTHIHVQSLHVTSYGFLQKPLVPASLDEVTVGTYWLKIGKSEDQVEGEIDKIKTK